MIFSISLWIGSSLDLFFYFIFIGFNCAEATNIATPGWLMVARDAAIRRVIINFAPLVSHSQLHYDLALSLSAKFVLCSSTMVDFDLNLYKKILKCCVLFASTVAERASGLNLEVPD